VGCTQRPALRDPKSNAFDIISPLSRAVIVIKLFLRGVQSGYCHARNVNRVGAYAHPMKLLPSLMAIIALLGATCPARCSVVIDLDTRRRGRPAGCGLDLSRHWPSCSQLDHSTTRRTIGCTGRRWGCSPTKVPSLLGKCDIRERQERESHPLLRPC